MLEGMYGASPGHNFPTVHDAFRYEIFRTGVQRNMLIVDNEGIATLHHDHIFVELVRMRGGNRGLPHVQNAI